MIFAGVFHRNFSNVVSGVDVNFLNIFFDNVLGRRHFDVERNIVVFRDVVYDRYFDSYVIKNRDLEGSVVRLSLRVNIGDGSVVFNGCSPENGLLILIIYLQMFSSQSGLNSVLFVDG